MPDFKRERKRKEENAKLSVLGWGGWAQTGCLRGCVKPVAEGGAAAGGLVPEVPRSWAGPKPARAPEPRQPRAREGPGAQAGARSCFRVLHTTGPSTQISHQKHGSGPFTYLLPRAHPAGADGPRTTGAAPEALQVARAPALSGTVARGGDPTRSSPPPPGQTPPCRVL